MPAKRDKQVATYVERVIHAVIMEGILAVEPAYAGLSISDYLRDLIIKDLRDRNLLTEEIQDLLMGLQPVQGQVVK